MFEFVSCRFKEEAKTEKEKAVARKGEWGAFCVPRKSKKYLANRKKRGKGGVVR